MPHNTQPNLEIRFDDSCPAWLRQTVDGCLLTIGPDPVRTGQFLQAMKTPHRDAHWNGPIYTLRAHGMAVEFDEGRAEDGTRPFCKVTVQDTAQPSLRKTLVDVQLH